MARPQQGRRDQLARSLPTIRVKMPDQLAVLRAACGQKVAFTSRHIAEAVGLAHDRTGLTMGFVVACGFVTKVSGGGIYVVNPRGARVAEAWCRDESLGRVELARNLAKTWFARATDKALEGGSGTRTKVMNRLMGIAKAPESRQAEVELLIEWMLEARLLVPGMEEGYLQWNAQALNPPVRPEPIPQAEQETPLPEDAESETGSGPDAGRMSADEPPVDDCDAEDSATAADSEYIADQETQAHIPPQREADPEPNVPISALIGLAQLAELAARPLQLAELLSLTEAELLALHRSLRSFATVLAAPKGGSARV